MTSQKSSTKKKAASAPDEQIFRQQNEYLSVLHQITLDLLNRRDMDELLQAVVDRAVILLDAPFGELMLEERGDLVVQTFTKNQEFLKGDRTGRDEATLSWQAFDTKQPVVLDDYSAYLNRRDIYSECKIHATAEIPVIIRDKCIGVLSLGRSQPGYVFNETQIKDGVLFAQLVALVLDSAQLLFAANHEIAERKQAESQREAALEALREEENLSKQMVVFTEELIKTGAEQVTYQKILENLLTISKAKYGALTLLNDSTGKFTTVAVAGIKDSAKKISKMFGFELVGKEWNEYAAENEQLEGQVVSHFSSMSELAGRAIPEIISKPIEKLLNMGEVIVTKIIVNHKMIGDFTLSMPAGKRFENDTLIEIYSRQIDIFLTRIKADEALRQSELRFRSLFEQTHDAVFILDLNGGHIAVNQRAADMLGYTKDEMAGLSINETSAETEQSHNVMRQLLAGEQIPFYERLFRRKDGSIIPVEVTVELVRDANGNPLHIQSMVRDITERKQMENALRESEKKYRDIYDNVSDVIYETDNHGQITSISPSAERHTGYRPAELIGCNVVDFFVQPEQYAALDTQLIEHGAVNDFESLLRRKNGGTVFVSITAHIVFDETGQAMATTGVLRDITERKQAEDSLKRSEQKYHALVENIPNTVFQCRNDSRYTFMYLNSTIEDLTGYPKEEFLENGLSFFDLYHPDDLPKIPTIEESPLSVINQQSFHMTYRIRHKSGEWRWVDEWGTGITNTNGNVEYLEGVMIDITEPKRMEEELQKERDFATQIINTMGQGLTVTDTDGHFEFVNPAYARLFGYRTADLLGKRPQDVTAFEHQAGLAEQRKHRQAGKTTTYESQLRRADGSVAQVLITAVPRGHNEQYAGAIAVITDLTEQKRVEDALRWNQTLLQLMSNSSPLGFLVVDNRTDDILYFNQRFCEIWGIQHLAERMQSGELKNNDIIPDCLPMLMDVPGFAESCKPLQDENNRVVVEDEIAFTEGRTVRRFSTQIRGERDEYYGRFYIFEDITARKQAEAGLRQAKESLETAHHELEQSFAREQQLARTDALTGLNSRGYLLELAAHEFEVAMRYRPPLSMVMVDVDHFKQINDTFGHAMGDQAIKHIAQIVRAEIRSADVVGRYGAGDEFIILLPQTSSQEAMLLADRIHASIATMPMHTDQRVLALTLSIGIAQTIHLAPGRKDTLQPDTVENLFLRTDQALYAAKQAGRNRTMVFDPNIIGAT